MATARQTRKALYTRNVKHKAQINQVHRPKAKHYGTRRTSDITSDDEERFIFWAVVAISKALLTPYGLASSCLAVISWAPFLTGDPFSMWLLQNAFY